VVHNRDGPEIFQNSQKECTPKPAFLALDLSIKHSRPFPSDWSRSIISKGNCYSDFRNFKNTYNSPCFVRLELTDSSYTVALQTYDVFLKYCYPGLCGIKICVLKVIARCKAKVMLQNVTGFWKITNMGANDTVNFYLLKAAFNTYLWLQ